MEEEEYQELNRSLIQGYSSIYDYIHNTKIRQSMEYADLEKFYFVKINGMGYLENTQYMRFILYACYSINIPFCLVFQSNGHELDVFLGTEENKLNTLRGIWKGKVLLSENSNPINENEVFRNRKYSYGGFLKGDIQKQEDEKESLIDKVVQGAYGEEFSIVIVAIPQEREIALQYECDWCELFGLAQAVKSKQVTLRNDRESISYSVVDYKVESYMKLIEGFGKKYAEAVNNGLWDVSVKYFANKQNTAEMLAGILIANSCGEDILPEPLHRFALEMKDLSYDTAISDAVEEIFVGMDKWMTLPVYSNHYTSNELANLTELPGRDFFGFQVHKQVDFDVQRENNRGISLGKILYKGITTEYDYCIDSNELIRHGLIVGLTGSGKTNFIKSLLLNIYCDKRQIPFLIIEPAKREYWELYKSGCDKLVLYAVGSKYNNYYINPFEKIGNISLQTHIDYIFAAFKASFIMYTPMPYVLENAIYEIYEDCGWNLENGKNPFGDIYPTIENLYCKIPHVVKKMGYDEKMQKDLIGSMQARINSLRVGNKGDVLNVKRSCPIEMLLKENTIVELEEIGDDDVKAFIMSLLFIQLSEYRIQSEDSQLEIKHLLLIEEAHRLLKNVAGGTGENADPRGNAVEFFCNLLAELRSKGQAFLIADQIPSKLAPDILKNTNLKVVHRLVAEEERNLVGKSMYMTEEQIEYISTFPQGVAAVYAEGDYRPKLVKSLYVGMSILKEKKQLTHEEVEKLCRNAFEDECFFLNQAGMDVICAKCPYECNGKIKKERMDVIRTAVEKCVFQMEASTKDFETILINAIEIIRINMRDVSTDISILYCFFKELLHKLKISKNETEKMVENFVTVLKENDFFE